MTGPATTVPSNLKQRFGSPLRPLSAMIEIADRCNEVCVHCYQIQGQKGEMSTAQLMRVMDEMAELGVLFLTISGGEPTLRKDFLELVEYARTKRFCVTIFTNGLRIDAAMARELGRLAVHEVQISLYSHRAEVHDGITRVPGSWGKTVAAIRALRSAGVAVVVKTPIMDVNAGDYREYIAFVESLGAQYSLGDEMLPREDGDRSPEQLTASPQALKSMRKGMGIEARERRHTLESPVCGACRNTVHVEPNGELRPCTQLNVPLGNAKDGIAQAYAENKNAALLRTLTWADLHGCRSCDLRSYCSRCYAKARADGGDALGPYAAACTKARFQYELVHGKVPQLIARPDGDSKGPYQLESKGVLRCIDDELTADDIARRRQFAWIQASNAEQAAPAAAAPTKLVQLRRPSAVGPQIREENRLTR